MVRPIIGLMGCFLLLTGCSGINQKLKMKDFVRTAEGYSKAISWSEFEAAAQFRQSDGSGEILKDLQNLEGVRVTNYTVKSLFSRKEDTEIEQFVEIKYYRVNEMIHKKRLIQEIWEYNPQQEQWYIKSRLPDLP